MADQNLTVKVEAKAAGDVKKPFKDLEDGAKKANEAVRGSERGLTEWAKTTGRVSGSVRQLRSGLLGLSTSVDLLPPSIGKAISSLNALGSATSALKGAGGLAAAVGVSGGTLGLIAAGIAAVGAAAVAVSPQLQDMLGQSMLDASGKAEQMAASIDRARKALADLRALRKEGKGTAQEEQQRAVELLGQDQQRSMKQQAEDWLAQMRGIAGSPAAMSDGSEEAVRQAVLGLQEVRGQQAHLDRRKGANREYAQIRERAKHLTDVNEEIKEAEAALALYRDNRGRVDKPKIVERLFEENNQPLFGQGPDAAIAALNQRLTQLRPQQAQLAVQGLADAPRQMELERLKAGVAPTDAETAALAKRQEDAVKRLVEAKKQAVEYDLKQLSLLKQQAVEQGKVAAEAAKEIEAKIRGSKISLALMDPEEQMEALGLSRKIKAGQQLDADEIRAAQGFNVPGFREAAEASALKMADSNQIIQEIIRNSGAQQKLEEAKAAQEIAVKLEATLNNKIEATVKLEAGEVAKMIGDAVGGKAEDLLRRLVSEGTLVSEMKMMQAIRSELEKNNRMIRAANKAAGGW